MKFGNARGVALPYVLIAIVVSGFVVQAFFMTSNNFQMQQATVQRAVDASLFIKGLSNIFNYAIGCSNALGYGYHTSTSEGFAATFDPDVAGAQSLAQIWDTSGAHTAMYTSFPPNSAGDPPATALAAPGLVIRRLSLIRAASDWNQGQVDIDVPDSAYDPAASAGAAPRVTVRAVLAKLRVDFENISPARTVFTSSISRTIDLTLYVERPVGSTLPWKVVTCTPGQGKVALPGWLSATDIITTAPGTNQAECPVGYYALGMIANSQSTGAVTSLQCARMVQ